MENWIYFLRKWIDEATRINIETTFRSTDQNYRFSKFFHTYVLEARGNWEKFKAEFRERELPLKLHERQNLYSQLSSEYNAMIDNYLKWYETYEAETRTYWDGLDKPYNPYPILAELCKDTLQEIKRLISDSNIKPGYKPEITLREIALIYIYQNKIITRENAPPIAREYGFESGDKLYQYYTLYLPTSNRIKPEDSKVKTKNKIQWIEKIIDYLDNKFKESAIKELESLKASSNKEFPNL
jgi:hypothetical protein